MASEWVEVFRGNPILDASRLITTVRLINKARRRMEVTAIENKDTLVIRMRVPALKALAAYAAATRERTDAR